MEFEMKKFSVLFFALVLALFCAACGSTTADDGDDENGGNGGNEGGNGGIEGDTVPDGDTDTGDTDTVDTDTVDTDTVDTDTVDTDPDTGDTGVCEEICKIKKADKENTDVTVNKSIVTGIEYNQDNNSHEPQSIKGFYVSEIIDKAQPYSGIYIFTKDAALDLCEIGDVLEISGKYKKYYGGPQIEALHGENVKKLDNTGITLPEPIEIEDPASIATPFEKQEAAIDEKSCKEGWTSSQQHGSDAGKYEGVLVKVKDVEIIEENICHGAFTVTGDLAIYKNLHYYKGKREAGKKFSSIQGVLIYSYNAYELAPTAEEDLVEEGGNSGGNGGNEGGNEGGNGGGDTDIELETKTIKDIQSGKVAADTFVEIKDVTIISDVYEYTKDGNTMYSFYVSDGNTGDYSGLYIFRLATTDTIAKGDKVDIEGQVFAFKQKDAGENAPAQWEIHTKKNVGSISKTGTGKVPAAVEKAAADLKDSDKGTYVKVTDELEVASVDTKGKVKFTNGLVAEGLGDVKLSLKEKDKVKISGIYDVVYSELGIFVIDANDVKK